MHLPVNAIFNESDDIIPLPSIPPCVLKLSAPGLIPFSTCEAITKSVAQSQGLMPAHI